MNRLAISVTYKRSLSRRLKKYEIEQRDQAGCRADSDQNKIDTGADRSFRG